MTGHWYEKSETSALFSLLTLALLFKFALNKVYKKIRTGKGGLNCRLPCHFKATPNG